MIKVNLIGAGNFDRMIFSLDGLEPVKAKNMINKCSKETDPFDLSLFIEKMASFNLPNSCFCDCTASDEIAACYDKILQYSIPVVTPNKKANSGSMSYYRKLTS